LVEGIDVAGHVGTTQLVSRVRFHRALAVLAVTAFLFGCVRTQGAETEPSEPRLRESLSSLTSTVDDGESSDFLPEGKGWKLVWADEFEGRELDTSRWLPEESCWGGGNQEQQCYTGRTENVSVENGQLRLTAQKESWTGPNLPAASAADAPATRTQPYTSGKVRTLNLASWKYGRFSARIKLPKGQGTWSAFWMMPEDDYYGGWPLSGEIDIMESVNLGAVCSDCGDLQHETRTQGALHFGGRWPDNKFLHQPTQMPAGASPADGFHVYTAEWGEGIIRWFMDDTMFFELKGEDWFSAAETAKGRPSAPFDKPFYLMLNLAVGGQLSAQKNEKGIDPEAFPAHMLVDWVRVYQCEPDSERGVACILD
jgi:beta-glucanase (GH16 family)